MTHSQVYELVNACRVPPSVPLGSAGLWEIRRFNTDDIADQNCRKWLQLDLGGHPSYTVLARTTLATLGDTIGEAVMDDSPRELRRHLPILLAARGRVLVTGLGLGCVLRGLLSKPEVAHVDVIEIDPDVIALVGPEFRDNPRVTIHEGDALAIEWPEGTRWDYAWHDIWDETVATAVLHGELLKRYQPMCAVQGAWQMPREVKRLLPKWFLGRGNQQVVSSPPRSKRLSTRTGPENGVIQKTRLLD